MSAARLLVAALLLGGAARAGAQGAPAAPPAATPAELLQRLEASWRARDVAAYLALWEFATVDAHEDERQYAEQAFAAEELQLRFDPPLLEPGREGFAVNLDVFSITEPRGRV